MILMSEQSAILSYLAATTTLHPEQFRINTELSHGPMATVHLVQSSTNT